MKFSIETPPNSNIFKQAIIKSLNENKQLIFSKKLTICQSSYQNNINNNSDINTQYQEFPLMEITDIKDIIDIPNTDGKLSGIICFFDKRTLFIEAITSYLNDNKTKDYIPLTSSIYFPLTREKLVMNCKSTFIKDEEIINKYWSSLTGEEKLQYETVDKDSIKPNNDVNEKDDLVKYIPQEQKIPSKNFNIMVLTPIKVWYTIFPMPQVIAHINKKKFESLLKPHKMPKKFLMNYDGEKKEWNSVQLN